MTKRVATDEVLPAIVKLRRIGSTASSRPSADLAGPYLVRFPSHTTPSTQLGGGECKWSVYHKAKSAAVQTLVAAAKEVDFVGSVRGQDAPSAPTTRLYLGVLDKKEGTLSYVPLEGQRVVDMVPAFSKPHLAQQRTEDASAGDALGSIKEQRAKRNAILSRVTIANTANAQAVAAMLYETAARARAEGRTPEAREQLMKKRRLLPPHNLQATELAQAFRWQDIIPSQAYTSLVIFKLLRAASDQAEREQLLSTGQLHPGAAELLIRASSAPDTKDQKHQAKLVACLSLLLTLYDCGRKLAVKTDGRMIRDLPGIAIALGVSIQVLEPLVPLFFSETDDARPSWLSSKPQRDLLLAYCLVLALLIAEGRMTAKEYHGLKTSLKMQGRDFLQRLRLVGASTKPTPAGDDYRTVTLLQDGKTLDEALPPVVPRKRASRRN